MSNYVNKHPVLFSFTVVAMMVILVGAVIAVAGVFQNNENFVAGGAILAGGAGAVYAFGLGIAFAATA